MDVKAMIEEKLSIFPKLYDECQIFGPIAQDELLERRGECRMKADCLKKNACENCVAIRSIVENMTISKYEEYNGKGINMIATPVSLGDERYVVELFRNLNQDDFRYLDVLKENVLEKIEQLNFQLMHDQLTGVFNRRFMEEKLPFGIKKCLNEHRNISIAVADIDHFKKVNDTYGHQTGDLVLKAFADTMSKNIDGTGAWTIRYGGEEFLLVMPNMDENEAYELVDKIRKAYEKLEVPSENGMVRSSVSFGVVTTDFMEESQESCMTRLIRQADSNLYVAKASGRNTVKSSLYDASLDVKE